MKPDQNVNEAGSAVPNGSAAAAILSAGVGCFCVSLFGLLGDAFPTVAHWFDFYNPTGPLSGVTTTAIIIWLLVWFILFRAWRGRTIPMGQVNAAAFALLGVGLLVSFPPLGDFLQGK